MRHHEHRPPHEVVLDSKDTFPTCHHCGEQVRFELIAAADQRTTETAPGNA